MENRELHIVQNICIAKNKVIRNGQVIYEYDTLAKFSDFSKTLYKKLDSNYPKFYKMDNLCKLTFLAGELLTGDKITSINLNEDTGLIFSNSASTIDTDKNFAGTLESIPSPAVFVYTLPNIALGELCIRHGWKGETLFLIQDHFDARQLMEQTIALFSCTKTSSCILGWAEYISDTNYMILLWLISNTPESRALKLSEIELLNDYQLQL
jgi:hypothetical protein